MTTDISMWVDSSIDAGIHYPTLPDDWGKFIAVNDLPAAAAAFDGAAQRIQRCRSRCLCFALAKQEHCATAAILRRCTTIVHNSMHSSPMKDPAVPDPAYLEEWYGSRIPEAVRGTKGCDLRMRRVRVEWAKYVAGVMRRRYARLTDGASFTPEE